MCTHPAPDGEEREEDGAVDVGRRVVEIRVRLGPRVRHPDEGDEEEEGPEAREHHIRDDVMLPRLDGGHLLKEPGSKKNAEDEDRF